MEELSNFGHVAALQRYLSRQLSAGDRFAQTLTDLCRSDRERLQSVDGSLIVPSPVIERLLVVGDEERIVMECAEKYPYLVCLLGYADIGEDDPVATALLIDTRTGELIDVARKYRSVVCFLGVQLRSSEVVNWTPSHPELVAERGSGRQRLVA